MAQVKRESQGRYTFVVVPGHPMADKRGRVLEHRYVMAESLGRKLGSHEVVHHKNEEKKDNAVSNLELTNRSDHSRMHNPAEVLDLQCAWCKTSFQRAARNTRGLRPFCSRSCSASFYAASKREGAPEHGTHRAYRLGCRCSVCRAFKASLVRDWRAKKHPGVG